MTATDTNLNPLRDTLFVERTLLPWTPRPLKSFITIDDLVAQLASGSESGAVWTITGTPGSGKSWFLDTLRDKLESHKLRVLWLDCAESLASTAYKDSDKALHGWVASPKEGGDKSASLLQEANVQHDKTVPAGLLLHQVIRRLSGPFILVVDAYHDLNDEQRDFLEQWFLVPYLRKQSARLVIALRDPFGVRAPGLTQATATLTLVPLSAIDQIRLRCEQLTKANETRNKAAEPGGSEAIASYKAAVEHILDPPPDALKDDDLARLYERSSEELEQIQSGLRDKLTGNPYINNLLLCYALCGNDNDLSSEQIEKIWKHYLRRAGLLDENGEPKIQIPLLEQIHTELGAEWTELDFGLKFGYLKLDEAAPLFDQGVIVTNADNDFYQIHPDIVALLTLRQGASRKA